MTSSNPPTTFRDILRHRRIVAGLTQELLAERARVSVRTVSDLERGITRQPYRSTAQSLAQALGLEHADAEAFLAVAQSRPRTSGKPSYPRRELPSPPTVILGRERELEFILHMIRCEEARFVTLTGAGGVGKTRLAEEIARELQDDFTGGAVLVSLASLADPALVPSSVGAALDIHPAGASQVEAALLGSLRDQELFLVLDNFEHLLPAADIISCLLAGCPRLKVLVTSREPLRLRGEREIDLSPLPVPGQDRLPGIEDLASVASVALLLQRARAVRSAFELTVENADSVAEICRRLEGLPLAIELAAIRLKHESPESLLEQMSRRLDILGPGQRDLPTRQKTMRAAIEWSYNLLTPAEQTVFRSLAVFAGGGEAQAVAVLGCELNLSGDVVGESLIALADKSLLRLEAFGGRRRFRMLETMREFAGDQLDLRGERRTARAAHAGHYLALAEEAYPELTGAQAGSWMDRLAGELDNLRLALRWYVEAGEVARGLRLAGALWRLWFTRGLHQEGSQWLDWLLDHPTADQAPTRDRGRALFASGLLEHHRHNLAKAERRYQEAEDLLRRLHDGEGLADVLNARGILATYEKNEFRRAEELFLETLHIARESGRPYSLARALENLGEVARFQGELEGAARYFEEGLETLHEMGEPPPSAAIMFDSYSRLLCIQGRYARARQIALACLERSRETNHWAAASSLETLGQIALAQGELAESEARFQESVARFEAQGAQGGSAATAVSLANLHRAKGAYAEARSALALYLAMDDPETANESVRARAYRYLGDVEQEQGNRAAAAEAYHNSLQLASKIAYVVEVLECVERIGWLIAGTAPASAATILGAAERLRQHAGMVLAPVDRPAHELALSTLRDRLNEPAVRKARNAGEAMDWRQVAASAANGLQR